MVRPDAPRPPPLPLDQIHPRNEEGPSRTLEDFFSRRQTVGNINPDDLEVLGDLGSGNGGYVSKVLHKPSKQVLARKVIRVDETLDRNRMMKELDVLKDCNSPYIVGYFGACLRDHELNLFMEYMDGRSLDSILRKTGKIREEILGKITIAVIGGLTYLRDKLNTMHRDIKPSNILVNSNGEIKICDFGVSVDLINSVAESFVGTRNYMSPERFTGQAYTVQSDIWSLGLTLVELALGMYPIPQHDPMKMYQGEKSPESSRISVFALMEYIINQPTPTVPGPPIFSAEFKDFVDRCLKKKPDDRLNLRSIAQHAFVIKAERTDVAVDGWVCHVCCSGWG